VFQAFHLIPTMTALENVAVPLELAGHRDAGVRAAAALDAVGLSHRLTHLPSRLSGGEQQRVAIARALANGPRVILADEPTGNLDSRTAADVVGLLGELCDEEGVTIILVTHDENVARRARRRVAMADGHVEVKSLYAKGTAAIKKRTRPLRAR
jgi:putative ABC transport system ATP-binding protein